MALQTWSHEENERAEEIDLALWTEDEQRKQTILLARGHTRDIQGAGPARSSSSPKTQAITLEKFSGERKDWDSAKRHFYAFLKSIKNEKNVPLYYILRDPNEEQDHRNNQGELGAAIYDAAHQGQLYLRDAFQVNQYLATWVGTGHALTHIRNLQDIQQ